MRRMGRILNSLPLCLGSFYFKTRAKAAFRKISIESGGYQNRAHLLIHVNAYHQGTLINK